ncbi:uncharacterized protein LY89DRAFT_686071 [Mollisia scopiformis]|uniref:Uncharacterized protein n=1 Tax=Mollisia scopiformis TaxID=149040 RepID=A0A194X540_MOLSC|nr:uncharacterized protein LY89DRAFT_686071 [Mollisia scopiformis]KUJ15296.1 hypothetical protein LY89DRAFT_686071 [Mollisia scopiformis]
MIRTCQNSRLVRTQLSVTESLPFPSLLICNHPPRSSRKISFFPLARSLNPSLSQRYYSTRPPSFIPNAPKIIGPKLLGNYQYLGMYHIYEVLTSPRTFI